MIFAVVDGDIVTAYDIAAIADRGLKLISTALVDLAFHEAAVASNGVEDEDVADSGIGPSHSVGSEVEHEVQYLSTVAAVLVGDIGQ